MEEYVKKDFEKILKSSSLSLRRWMKESDSDCGRVYDRNLTELPLTVDFYSSFLKIVDYGDEELSKEERDDVVDIISRFLYVEKDKIIYKYRKKREGREQSERGEESLKVSVKENGLFFECDLSLYLDTGLFLESEKVREVVRDLSKNEKVLNLFSYTGSLSIYAAVGGAEEVVSVDLSNVYTEWAKRNLVNNGFLDEKKYKCVKMDVREYLKEAKEKGEKYDLIIIDPPSFSNSHRVEDFDIQDDYLELLLFSADILLPDGIIIFSENKKNFIFDKKEVLKYFKVEEITSETTSMNFINKNRLQRTWIMKKDEKKDSYRDREKSAVRTKNFHEKRDNRKESKDEERRDYSSSRKDSHYREKSNNAYYSDSRREYKNDDLSISSPHKRDDNKSRNRYGKYEKRDEKSHYGEGRSEKGSFGKHFDNQRRDNGYGGERKWEDGKMGNSKREDSYDGNRKSSFKDNSTSHIYKKEYNRNRKDNYTKERREKKTSPKPFGYDTFSPSKKRDDANIAWIKNQTVIEDEE